MNSNPGYIFVGTPRDVLACAIIAGPPVSPAQGDCGEGSSRPTQISWLGLIPAESPGVREFQCGSFDPIGEKTDSCPKTPTGVGLTLAVTDDKKEGSAG